MGFEKDAPLPHDFSPTFENGNHDLLDHECFRVGAQFLDQLDDEWWIVRTLEVSSVKGEKGDQKSLFPKRAGNPFPHEKAPAGVAVAVGETESVGKVTEPFATHVRQVAR